MSSHAVLIDVLSALPLKAVERDALIAAMNTMRQGEGLRSAYADKINEQATSLPEERRAQLEGLFERLPRRPPFAFMPISEMVVRLTLVASALLPDTPLVEATNLVMRRHIRSLRRSQSLRAFLESGQGDLFDYLEVVTESASHFYNFGARSHQRVSSRLMILHFEAYFTTLSRYWIVGLNEALMDLFEVSGEIAFHAIDQERFELHVQLDD